MTVTDIIESLDVIRFFNPNMSSLFDRFVAQEPLMTDSAELVESADEGGAPIYEVLIGVQIELANAIHDYVYNVTHPFDSILVKNVIREQTCREVFGLEAHF
jgi:hypothetical protein